MSIPLNDKERLEKFYDILPERKLRAFLFALKNGTYDPKDLKCLRDAVAYHREVFSRFDNKEIQKAFKDFIAGLFSLYSPLMRTYTNKSVRKFRLEPDSSVPEQASKVRELYLYFAETARTKLTDQEKTILRTIPGITVPETATISYGDFSAKDGILSYKNRSIDKVTGQEYKMIVFFMQNPGMNLEVKQIGKAIAFDTETSKENVQKVLSTLRQALKEELRYDPIKTVRNIGYSFRP